MDKDAPIFQSIFSEQWNALPPVMHKHYANRPMSRDRVTVEGTMQVQLSLFAKLLSPFLRMAGALAPYAGNDIPTTVHFRSEPDTNAFCFERIFRFPGKAPYHFRSRMVPVGGAEVVELMPIHVGWHARFAYDGANIILEHRGYKLLLFGKLLRVPLEWFLGKGHAEEIAIDADRFRMAMTITHPLFGQVYAYSGEFTITEVTYDR